MICTDQIKARFLSKTKVKVTTPCWEWTGGKNSIGYGYMWVNGRNESAHRVAYEIHVGPIPDGLFVCHRCDNRGCVNPDHLFLGTHQDNMDDKVAKNRQARGKQITGDRSFKGAHNAAAKLSEQDVLDIRSAVGIKQIDLAKHYGISQTHISAIRNGHCWTHLR